MVRSAPLFREEGSCSTHTHIKVDDEEFNFM